jgi:hypothetical protein
MSPIDTNAADLEAAGETTPGPLRQRHPAELTTFIASLVIAAGALGFEVSTEVVVACFVLIGTLPAIVTWAVNLYRDAFRDLGE